MASLELARQWVLTQARECAGVRTAPNMRVQDQANAMPAVSAHVSGVVARRESGSFKKTFWTFTVSAYVARADIGRAVETVQPLLEEFISRLMADVTLGDNVSHIEGDVRGSVGAMDYGGISVWGCQVVFDVKIVGS